MKVLIVAAVITLVVALTWASSIPAQYYPREQQEKLDRIVKEAEEFYQTLPKGLEEDATLLIPEIIKKYGYPSEVHTTQSSDGYILELHRIPHGVDGPSDNRPAVYLQHGILSSSADWVLAGPGKGLAYILADAGYDVWMPNTRGTRYSRKHATLDPDKDKSKYWDFSFHEIAVYDVPAMMDYVINFTKQAKVFYIAHSQGTTIFYILMSEKPEYNNKVRAMFSLAPIAYMGWMTSPLMRLIALADWGLGIIFELIGMYEFLPQSGFLAEIGDLLCSDGSITQILCTNSLFAVCGFNAKQMNETLLPVIMGHTPAGSSTKQFLHFAQSVNSRQFRKWDYGLLSNLVHYGSLTPPKYKLNKVTAPVYLFYSRNDWLSNEKDVLILYEELGNVQAKFLVPDNKFNHVDYMYGIEAPELVYIRVVGLMRRH